jgi:hypothetical protein
MRNAAGQFTPGMSGNPTGRGRLEGEIRTLARQYTATAITRLAEICLFGKDREAIVAAQELLDRGWGRPAQAVQFEDLTPPKPSMPASTMSAADACEHYRALLHAIH